MADPIPTPQSNSQSSSRPNNRPYIRRTTPGTPSSSTPTNSNSSSSAPITEKSRGQIAADFTRGSSSSQTNRRRELSEPAAKPPIPRATTAKNLNKVKRGEQPQSISVSPLKLANPNGANHTLPNHTPSAAPHQTRAYRQGDTLVFEKSNATATTGHSTHPNPTNSNPSSPSPYPAQAGPAGRPSTGKPAGRSRQMSYKQLQERDAKDAKTDDQPAHFAMSMKAMTDTGPNTTATTPRPGKVMSKARTGKLRIIPLGGLGEIGKNIMAYETDNDLIVVDAGMTFPNETMPGIDLVIPDISYVIENKKKLRGLVITHAHEDHIGAIPYIWPKMGCPIYASPLTAGLIKVKMEEHGHENLPMHIIKAGDKIRLGDFEIEPVRVTHSIPDALAFAIRTKHGLFAHFTDWKIDHTPISGDPMDFVRIAELSREGVKLLLSESTNIEVPGYTISESVLSDTFDNIFKNARGRIIFTTFASMVNRIQQAFDASVKYGRKVAISGRSLEKYIDEAMKLGFLKVPQGTLIDIRTVTRLQDHQIVYLTTGSQGEEYSALSRISSGEHRHIQVKRGDVVVISASIIPGNESSIFEVVNNLYKQGAQVIYGKQVDIHVSGHANEEELKMVMAMMKPEYFIPIHGEFRHLVKHGRMAERLGVDPNKIFILENGGVIEFDEHGVGSISNERVQAGQVLVDGLGVGDVGNIVLRDRQAMAKDGIFVVILTVDKQTGNLVNSPDIISRGFVYMRAAEDLIFKARQEVKKMFATHNGRYPMNYDYIRRMIRDEMGEYLFEFTQRRPMIIPVIIEA